MQQFTPEAFDEEVAFERIEPDIQDRIRVILKYGLAALSQGLPVNPETLDPVKLAAAPAAVNNVSPQQAVALLRMAYGG